ncbi:MAG TPA: phosphatidylglycerophosphatase A [Candidatus Peribacteraceae bacterium]|nr:phosphatidylglycerophosphatase A [Candidatus Peribacteraceae bacterium]
MKRLTTFFLSLFGVGFISGIEGTLASILSIPIILQVYPLLPSSQPARFLLYGCITLVLMGFGVAAIPHCPRAPKDNVDQPFIVLDEMVGMMVALLPVMMMIRFVWYTPVIALALFRFFDILKPLGIGAIDRRNTPLSVMMDDVLAGTYSAVILLLLMRIL